ncbi:Rne/Rng family ribonuclease [Acuticoccus sp. M5D2P5]|uniref:Rne/Rng family ribonuclease n=1 Tax=Acuticoccus kalidii TaxID=2910977 RepID=UPI001F43A91D|nr:ribonuclease E/G [Acuticoccus kalidii]MCF3934438.1 Rne/Rng family ribonuclease [Acuticoccus kalidii]
MSNKMLIDAIHPEETRVVVVRDKRVEDFDFEAASKKPLRGNIYLAKVTRVEPSLQAAFIEYGGNRHGFLAFSEIHPDYYQIPAADRAELLEAEREEEREEEAPAPAKRNRRRTQRGSRRNDAASETAAPVSEAATDDVKSADDTEIGDAPVALAADEQSVSTSADSAGFDVSDEADNVDTPAMLERAVEQIEETMEADIEAAVDMPIREIEVTEPAVEAAPAPAEAPEEAAAATGEEAKSDEGETPEGEEPAKKPRRRRTTRAKKSDTGLADPQVTEDDESEDDEAREEEANAVTSLGSSDALEEIPERRRNPPRRNYKIQEVIKRRQILLVQVVKEERGTKGAALTTYLSLAGRYSVLMPNTDRGGGVSRKITDSADRKRLKSLVGELEVPEGMGIILRTAGAARTKTEIRRDFEYLLRLWESVRELTLKSVAPELVYEEGNLVKRAIRDLYNKEIDEVLVSGDTAYREAKDFMRMLMPSHAKNVKQYRGATPIFTGYGVESQLDAMFSPHVTLPSKGYIVINPTEALVSIDVNSGRSTKENSIEDTALKTNLEAADEVARQLRLRDLAGLIVIDFIDMDEKRHNRAVEKRLKDALKLDRSRIQVGRISPFGLLEMSRQRIRQGMVETSMVPCSACGGTGHVRSTQSVALFCLRSLEEYLLKQSDHHITIKTSAAVALYILNQKRSHIQALEETFKLNIGVDADETLSGQHMEIVSGALVDRTIGEQPPTTQIAPDAVIVEEDEDTNLTSDEDEAPGETSGDASGGERSSRRRRRRRRRGGGSDEPREANARDDDQADDGESSAQADGDEDGDGEGDGDGDGSDERRGRRRRGRRGGRRHRREDEEMTAEGDADAAARSDDIDATEDAADTLVADAPKDVVHVDIEDGVSGETPMPSEVSAAADADEPAEAVEAADIATPEADTSEDEAQTAEAAPAEEAPAEASTADVPSDEEAQPDDVAASQTVQETPEPAQASQPKEKPRAGWWQRRSFF